MKIKRVFTVNCVNDIFSAKFKKISVEIKSSNLSSLYKTVEVEVPDFWSKSATDLLVGKYLKKTGIPSVTKKIIEKDVPEWLQKSEADIDYLNKLPEEQRYIGENSAKQIFIRLAGAWTYWGYKLNYFDSEQSAKIFFDEVCYILCHQISAPHSPHWFNVGINWAYGILGESQDYFYFDENTKKIIKSKNSYEKPQTNSCFIQGIEDDLFKENGFLDLIKKESKLLQHGSGSGTNFSSIKSKGEPVRNNEISFGLMSFLKVKDINAGLMNSLETVKKTSKRILLDVDHPEIEDFISWKLKEEQKLVSLVTGSEINHKILQLVLKVCEEYDGSNEEKIDINVNKKLRDILSIAKSLSVPGKFIRRVLLLAKQQIFSLDFDSFSVLLDSESYRTVSGQNSKNTVVVSNLFLNTVLNNKKWNLINRTDGSISKTVDSYKLWEKINYSVWSCMDPSLHYDDTINDWHTCSIDGKIKGSNTYSEFLFLDDTSCGLVSINLLKFRKKDATFDVEKFSHVVSLFTIMLDICVSMTGYPSEKIANLSNKYRPIGLGYCNMASYLMSLALPYDSEKARNLSATISSLLTAKSYETSSFIAKKKGSFDRYKENSSNMLRVLRNHRRASNGEKTGYEGLSTLPVSLDSSLVDDKNLIKEVLKSWDSVIVLGEQFGFRNAQVTLVALADNISILMDCSTTGIEPEFALVKYKYLEKERYSKVVNPEVLLALEILGYTDEEILDISNYMTGYKTLLNAPSINHKTLKNKGFTEIELEKLENVFSNNISNIEFAFNIPILGEDFCVNKLGIKKENFKDPNFSLLQYLGFNKDEVLNANIYVTGSRGLEKAPSLKRKHVNIFDCSVPCGMRGTRYLSWQAHVNMLAAVQPFLSGGVCKNIMLSKDSNIIDCSNVYMEAWKKAAKTALIYIGGSKLFQPLQENILNDDKIKGFDLIEVLQKIQIK